MNKQLIEALNKQINFEFQCAYFCFAMSTNFETAIMDVLSKNMIKKAFRRLQIAKKLCSYMCLRQETITFSKINEPNYARKDVSGIFLRTEVQEQISQHELIKLHQLALMVNDKRTAEFLKETVNSCNFCNKHKSNNENNRAFEVYKYSDRELLKEY